MSVFSYEMKDGMLNLAVDSNDDGEKVLSMKLNVNEAMQEMMKRGAAVEGVKLVGFEFSASKLMLKIDSDQDGESVLELEIDLLEAFDEVKDAIL